MGNLSLILTILGGVLTTVLTVGGGIAIQRIASRATTKGSEVDRTRLVYERLDHLEARDAERYEEISGLRTRVSTLETRDGQWRRRDTEWRLRDGLWKRHVLSLGEYIKTHVVGGPVPPPAFPDQLLLDMETYDLPTD